MRLPVGAPLSVWHGCHDRPPAHGLRDDGIGRMSMESELTGIESSSPITLIKANELWLAAYCKFRGYVWWSQKGLLK